MIKSIYQSSQKHAMAFVNTSQGYYIAQFVGNVSKKYYQDTLKSILKYANNAPYPRLILNTKDMQNIPDLGKQWLLRKFIPSFYKKTGGLKLAILNSSNPLERKSIPLIANIIKISGLKVQVQFFDDMPSATHWLFAKEEKISAGEQIKKMIPYTDKIKPKEIQVLNVKDKQKKSRFKFSVKFDPEGKLKPKEPQKNIWEDLSNIFSFFKRKR
jgi:hypothetical protein